MSSASTSYVLARVKNRILNETFADLINLNQSDYSAHVELTIGDKLGGSPGLVVKGGDS